MMEKRIGYRPHIEYQDEYQSDASNLFNNQNEETEEIENSQVDDLIEQGEVIQGLIDKLPGNSSEMVQEVFDQIIDFIENELNGKEYNSIPDEWDWSYDNVKPEEIFPDIEAPKDDDKFTEEDFWNDTDMFPITKTEHTKEEIIEKEYVKNLIDLFDDYFVNLHTILSTLWTNLVIAIINKPTNEINIMLNNILLNSSDVKNDAKHLLDSAIRTQLLKDIKFGYFNNLFNAEETIKHLHQFKAIYELRLRYASIEEIDSINSSTQMNNNILNGMQIIYDKKYDIAYENLYRYLKSSNEVLDDVFKTWIAEIKSKQTLLERKGVN